MSRRRAAVKRKVLPDPVYKSRVISKFMNRVMLSGKKSIAEKIVYNALDKIAQENHIKEDNEIVRTFEEALGSELPSALGLAVGYQIRRATATERALAIAIEISSCITQPRPITLSVETLTGSEFTPPRSE